MDQELIRRYLKDKCTPQEREQVKALMQSGEAKPLFDQVLAEHWNKEEDLASADQLALWKDKFSKRMTGQQETIRRPLRNYSWLKYAAILAIILSVATYALFKYAPNSHEVVAMQETVNPNGKMIRITLSDSSVVTLNAASRLKYPASFNGKTREVYLEGEAFFDVAHDKAHPFVVHTQKIKVSVLGTSFNVKSYLQDKSIAVAVASGKVGVLANQKGSRTFMLLPGDKLAYNHIGKDAVQSKVDRNEIGTWQSGMFVFHNETLENITRQLERRYDVKFIFKDESLRQKRFNFKQKNDRLENVMQTLVFAGGIKYKVSGNTVTIAKPSYPSH